MRHNILNKSFFGKERAFERIDAEYADPVLLEIESVLKKHAGFRIGELTKDEEPETIKEAEFEDEQSIAYVDIDSVAIDDGLTFDSSLIYKDRPSRAKYVLQEGNLLVSNVRPNRNAVTQVSSRHEKAIASSGFTLLDIPSESAIQKEFVFAFLKTEYGRGQLVRRDRGSMYPAVVKDDVLDVYVPKPPPRLQGRIVKLIRQGLQNHDLFFRTIEDQEEMIGELLHEIGAPPSPFETRRTGADWNEIRKNYAFVESGPQRLDAEYYRREYDDFDAQMQKRSKTFLLGEYFDLFNGRSVGDGEEDVVCIRQSALTNAGLNWSAVSLEGGSIEPERGRVRIGDVLLACTAHEIYYVGRRVDFVRDMPQSCEDNNVAVADIMIMRPKGNVYDLISGSYVAAFLRSDSGLFQVQRCIRGLRGGHVYSQDLGRYVRIPIPPDSWRIRFDETSALSESYRNRGRVIMHSAFQMAEKWVASLIAPSSKM